jgi:hypothetical protein
MRMIVTRPSDASSALLPSPGSDNRSRDICPRWATLCGKVCGSKRGGWNRARPVPAVDGPHSAVWPGLGGVAAAHFRRPPVRTLSVKSPTAADVNGAAHPACRNRLWRRHVQDGGTARMGRAPGAEQRLPRASARPSARRSQLAVAAVKQVAPGSAPAGRAGLADGNRAETRDASRLKKGRESYLVPWTQ